MANQLQLQDKVIWITGALGLIGRAATALFLERGACVFGTDIREPERHPEIVRLQGEYGNRLRLEVSDATDEDRVRESAGRIRETFGRLDGLFHNSYTQIEKKAFDMTLGEWDAVLRGTLTSAFLANKYAGLLMVETGGGAIVNTSSILGQVSVPDSPAAYSTAKAGMNHLTRIIAVDYAGQGIRANAIVPGDIKAADHPRQFTNNLIGRSGRPEEVAELAAYLLSDAAAYVTGAIYAIDGGFRL